MVAFLAATENYYYYYFGKKETSFKTDLEPATALESGHILT